VLLPETQAIERGHPCITGSSSGADQTLDQEVKNITFESERITIYFIYVKYNSFHAL
jgi:hypothetical protein